MSLVAVISYMFLRQAEKKASFVLMLSNTGSIDPVFPGPLDLGLSEKSPHSLWGRDLALCKRRFHCNGEQNVVTSLNL